jgi:hypothetical protein
MTAIQNLLSDGKGLIGLALLLAATVLAALGKMPIADWQTFATWLFGIYAGSSALHGGLSAIGSGLGSSSAPAAPAATSGEAK